jgi:hypothetical protein
MAKVAKIWDGTAWVDLATSVPDLSNYQLKSEGGLTLVKKQTIGTAVSSVTVTDAFSATYDNYKIMIGGGNNAVGLGNIGLKLGATATGYYAVYPRITYSAATVLALSDNNFSEFSRAGVSNVNGIGFNVELLNPFLTKNTFFQSSCGTNDSGSTAFPGTGYLNDTTSYTAFTITPGAGTLTGGTIYVYGYNKG